MSEPRSAVHAANTTDWKPLDFLGLARVQSGFQEQAFHARTERGFQRHPVEAMPDNSLRAPGWRPAAGVGTTQSTPAGQLPGLAIPTTQPGSGQPSSPLNEAQAAQIREEAFAQGLAQGRSEGEAAASQRHRQELERLQQQDTEQTRQLLGRIEKEISLLRQHPDALHEPLKRLALHMAEELVLAQLRLDTQAIDRLVQRCVDAIDGQGAKEMVIELNPQDLAMLRQHPDAEADRPQAWVWQANPDLLPGSVRVYKDQAVVTDLIEHRLQALARQLLPQPQAWASSTAFDPVRLAERQRQQAPVEDALPRMDSATGFGQATSSKEESDTPPQWMQAAPLAQTLNDNALIDEMQGPSASTETHESESGETDPQVPHE